MMNDMSIQDLRMVERYVIQIIGETVEGKSNRVRRTAAKQIIEHDMIILNAQNSDVIMLAGVEIAHRLANFSTYFAEALLSEAEPYSTGGITFPALVYLLRLEADLFAWGWLAEQVSALGLAINPGDEVDWPITRELVTIKDRQGNCRPFYRCRS